MQFFMPWPIVFLCGAAAAPLTRGAVLSTLAADRSVDADGQTVPSQGFFDGNDNDYWPTDEDGQYQAFLIFSGNSTLSSWLPQSWNLHQLTDHINLHVLLVPVILGFALLALMLSSMVATKGKREEPPLGDAVSPASSLSADIPVTLHKWSILGITALTSYRFYTGFLSATWMPYLLAMEGKQLMSSRQSVFMGTAKLIYGMSILMNPLFGLVGDQMAVISHWSGRRLFVIGGVGAGGLGIYGCVVAAQIHSVWWYMAGTVLWMLGEAMADVTTETLVPELLPKSQYEVSSAIRALNFLLGGLVGYAALIVFRHFHYSWLYYGYLIVMLVCAFFTLCFINTDDLVVRRPKRKNEDIPLRTLMAQAYYMPARLEGGFPMACLCLFVFSLGSAPMFFLLLMVRDIIGIKEHVSMQMHFSFISIVFFISAAVASVLGVATAGGGKESSDSQAASSSDPPVSEAGKEGGGIVQTREGLIQRWKYMVFSTILFGAVAAAIPFDGFLPTLTIRKVCFYFISVAFGFSFGAVYARFQECTWSLLPAGVDVANAMGFAAMAKLAGVGIGNFFAGIILDVFSAKDSEQDYGEQDYSLSGYLLMSLFCSFVVLLAAYLAHGVGQVALANFDKGSHLTPQVE